MCPILSAVQATVNLQLDTSTHETNLPWFAHDRDSPKSHMIDDHIPGHMCPDLRTFLNFTKHNTDMFGMLSLTHQHV